MNFHVQDVNNDVTRIRPFIYLFIYLFIYQPIIFFRSSDKYIFSFTVDQQFLLKRLADAAIDIYGMAAVLSR